MYSSSEKISRIPHQEGPVTSSEKNAPGEADFYQEKARAMAETENAYQVLASLYEKYLSKDFESEDGDSYAQFVRENATALKEVAFNEMRAMHELMNLKEAEMTPEYIRRYGELKAELQGEVFDLTQQLATLDDAELARMEEAARTELETINPGHSYSMRFGDPESLINEKIPVERAFNKYNLIKVVRKNRPDKYSPYGLAMAVIGIFKKSSPVFVPEHLELGKKEETQS